MAGILVVEIMTRTTRWTVATLAVFCSLAGGTLPAQPQVVAHVRVHGVDRFSRRVSALYEALGVGDDLYSEQRVLSEGGRQFPAPSLEGVDRTGAFGFLLVWVDEGPLVRVPFCVLSDRQAFACSVQQGTTSASEDSPEPILQDMDGGMLVLPGDSLTEVTREYVHQQKLFDTLEPEADLSILISLSRLAESRAATVRNWSGILFALAAFGPSDDVKTQAGLARIGLEQALRIASGWRQVRLELNLADGGLEMHGELDPVPGSKSSDWLDHSHPLPVSALPALLAGPVVQLEVGGDGGRRIGAFLPLDGEPLLSQLLSMITGELCVTLGSVEGEPALMVLAACEDPGRFKLIVDQSQEGTDPATRIVSGGNPDVTWSAAQVGNWILLAIGGRSEVAAEAALGLLHEPPGQASTGAAMAASSEPGGESPFLRLEVDPAGALSLLAARMGFGAAKPSARSGETLSLNGWASEGRLRVHLDVPFECLRDCVPTVRIR